MKNLKEQIEVEAREYLKHYQKSHVKSSYKTSELLTDFFLQSLKAKRDENGNIIKGWADDHGKSILDRLENEREMLKALEDSMCLNVSAKEQIKSLKENSKYWQDKYYNKAGECEQLKSELQEAEKENERLKDPALYRRMEIQINQYKEIVEKHNEFFQRIIDNKFYLNNSLLHNTAKQLLTTNKTE